MSKKPAPEKTPAQVVDGYANLMSRLGTKFDRNTQGFYTTPIIDHAQLENQFRSSWLTRKIHTLVPTEMTRAGRTFNADKEDVEKLVLAEKKLGIWRKIRKALVTARVHGGAAIILGVRQGLPDTPLQLGQIRPKALSYAVVVSRHQLSAPDGFISDLTDPLYGHAQMWELRTKDAGQLRIHPSRVLTFHGNELPEGCVTVDHRDQFWGDPLLTSIKSAIDNAEVSQASVATLLHQAKRDVISIPGLTQQIATKDGEAVLQKRIEAIEEFQSLFNVLVLDGGNAQGKGKEEWESRELSFAQQPDLLEKFLNIVSGATDIPVTRLLGLSPGGMQSTGKGEQKDFNRMLATKQDDEIMPQLDRFDEILYRSALGTSGEASDYSFNPLDAPDEKEAAEIEKLEAETVQIYMMSNTVPPDALAASAQQRLVESGRWPGLEEGIEESTEELDFGSGEEGDDLPPAANENDVANMERQAVVDRDTAMSFLADASPRTLYVSRQLLNADEVVSWAKGTLGLETTLPAEAMHVTVLFSRDHVDWMKATGDWNEEPNGELVVQAGGARLVETLGPNGAVVLLFSSSRLSWRHEQIKNETGAAGTFNDYQPHVTLTYEAPPSVLDALRRGEMLEPYRGQLRFGPERFEEVVEDWRPEKEV